MFGCMINKFAWARATTTDDNHQKNKWRKITSVTESTNDSPIVLLNLSHNNNQNQRFRINWILINKISFFINDTLFVQRIEDFIVLLSFLNLLLLTFGSKIFDLFSHAFHQLLPILPLSNNWLFLSPILSRHCVQQIMWSPISCYKIKNELKR